MNDSVLDRILPARTGERELHDVVPDAERSEDLGAFGYLRGVRDRAVMLELRKKTGVVRAIGYAWLERVDFDASEGITLHASGQKIRIIGRCLNVEVRPNVRLFQGLIRHRVPWLQEADEPADMAAGERDVVIERIDW